MIFRHSPFSFIRDLKSFFFVTKNRLAHFEAAGGETPVCDFGANITADRLHPARQTMTVTAKTEEDGLVYLALKGGSAAFFRSGQSVNILSAQAVYPALLVSSPEESLDGVYRIALTDFSAVSYSRSLNKDDEISLSAPVGTFYYSPLRDGEKIAFACDVTGKALASAMKNDIKNSYPSVTVTDDCSEKDITALFAIGGKEFCDGISHENASVRKLITEMPGQPLTGEKYTCTVLCGEDKKTIPVYSGETVETALERAGAGTPQKCPDGECGFCRCRLVDGKIRTEDVSPCGGLRTADAEFGYIHPCRSFACGDITLKF